MVFPFAAARCSAFPTCPSVFIPDYSGENAPPGRNQPHPGWQFLNLRLSTPVSSANIAPFTDMHSGLSHANDASSGVPGRAPRQRCGAPNRVQSAANRRSAAHCVRRRTRGSPSIKDED
jgi:hypothetical protein